MWVAKAALQATGRVVGDQVTWVDTGATTITGAATLNGAAYEQDFGAVIVTTEAVAASDTFIGGFRYRSDGALRVVDATAGVPAGSNTNQGFALNEDGRLCYVIGDGTRFHMNGVPVDGSRRVYVAPLAFALEFADAGAGVVTTTEAITGATPTFTRATTATTVLSTGLIGSVASGDPRSYYDPTTLAYLGYLAEGARTNLCLQSEDFATTWTATRASVDTNEATSPDGATTADELIEDSTATSTHEISQSFTKAASALAYAFTCWVKREVGSRNLYIDITDTAGNGVRTVFNLGTGEVSAAAAAFGTGWTGAASSVKSYPSGWYRLELQGTSNSATDLRVVMAMTSGTTFASVIYSGDGVSSVVLFGAQLEQAAFASSYIPTTTAAVTRNADVLTYPTTGWLNAAVGTMFVQYQVSQLVTALNIWSLDDGTANENILLFQTPTQARFAVVDGGVSQAAINGGALTANTTAKSSAAWSANDFATTTNGAAVATDTSGTIPTVTQLQIGLATNSLQISGPIRRVAYYAARLANATLQGLTNG